MKKKMVLILEYSGVIAIILLLIGLTGWYVFLRGETAAIEQADADRGIGLGIPTFSGSSGSTFSNILSGFGWGDNETNNDASQTTKPAPDLWQVNITPVTGIGFIHGTSTLRYVERATGYVFDADPESTATVRLTNTLLPKMYETVIAPDGRIAGRIQKDDERTMTFSGTVVHSTSTPDEPGRFALTPLGDNIHSIAVGRDDTLITLAMSGGGSALLKTSWDGSGGERLFESYLPMWVVQVLADGRIILSEPPASGLHGSAYELSDGLLDPLARALPGLTVLPRTSSEATLMSEDTGRAVTLSARTARSNDAFELPVHTITEKCVWAPDEERLVAYCAVPRVIPANFLDRWHRGSVHTSDSWWTLDIAAGVAEPLYSPETTRGVEIDVINPVIDANGSYLAFMNARDGSAWMLRVKKY